MSGRDLEKNARRSMRISPSLLPVLERPHADPKDEGLRHRGLHPVEVRTAVRIPLRVDDEAGDPVQGGVGVLGELDAVTEASPDRPRRTGLCGDGRAPEEVTEEGLL